MRLLPDNVTQLKRLKSALQLDFYNYYFSSGYNKVPQLSFDVLVCTVKCVMLTAKIFDSKASPQRMGNHY